MFHSLYSLAALAALVLCCGFAVVKGGPAERAGGLLICGTWFASLAAAAVSRSYLPAMAFLAADFVVALGLLILAVRYSSLWMGAAMLVQALVLSLHAGYFGAEKADLSTHVLNLYILGKNLASGAQLVIILAATVASIIGRNLVRRREAMQAARDVRADIWLTPAAGPEPTAFGRKSSSSS